MSDNFVIEVSPQEHSSIRELIVSFLRAIERFRAEDSRASESDEQLAVQSRGRSALAEALNWADSIDHYLSQGPKYTPRDAKWVEQFEAADQNLLRAFQRVRNVVHHQWWEAVGVRLLMVSGVQVNEWFWGPLPVERRQGPGKDKNVHAYDAYSARLEGRRVLETLDDLAGIFWTKRRWRITPADLEQPGQTSATPLILDNQ
jgi:hypothetical protein